MSVLTWLFGLGLLSIAFPLFFHLIRRRPQGEMTFSSLMFLRSTPPRVSRKSRLENLFLLLLRCLAIALIAAAFMRPYFSDSGTLSISDLAARRIVILVDQSASMQRAGLWDQAQKNVKNIVDALDDRDEVAVYLFDDQVDVLVDFPTKISRDSSSSDDLTKVTSPSSTSIVNRSRQIVQRLNQTVPNWHMSDIGSALTTTAGSLTTWRDAQALEEGRNDTKLQIVVVSDMQKTNDLQSLQSYQWPEEVFVELKPVTPNLPDNATVQILQSKGDSDSLDQTQIPGRRVRVTNSPTTESSQFVVKWFQDRYPNRDSISDSTTASPQRKDSRLLTKGEIPFLVPPGESRIIPLPDVAAATAARFELVGDGNAFDNTCYAVPATQRLLEVLYVGNDNADDPESILFYLQRAIPESENLKVNVRSIDASQVDNLLSDGDLAATSGTQSATQEPSNRDRASAPSLMVISSQLNKKQQSEISNFVERGGLVLLVLDDQSKVGSLSVIAGLQTSETTTKSEPTIENSAEGKRAYSMWVDLDFNHWLLLPFANPKYNDFTKIRFWRHPIVPAFSDESAIRMVARFDDDMPAIWEHQLSKAKFSGSVIVMASGWQPSASQLALSSKFVPFLGNLIQKADRVPKIGSGYLVGQSLPIPPLDSDRLSSEPTIVLTKPDGSTLKLSPEDLKNDLYTDTNLPGIYEFQKGGNQFQFAVNLDRRESETTVLSPDQFAAFKVPLDFHSTAIEELNRVQQLKDVQLESQQKLWKWLIVSAIILLTIEAILAAIAAGKPIPVAT